ncbi:DUF4405 domain-containing protein [Chloroflexota bacterium]
MNEKNPIKFKVYARAIVAILMIAVWSLAAFTGLLLWLAPEGQRSGQRLLLLNLTKSEWGDIHFWVCVAVVVITITHIIIDWKALKGVIRYLISAHRSRNLLK